MLERIRAHLTYANVISTLCLFLLLGGGAYAAFSLPKDSVKSKHIVDGQVKSADLAKPVVHSAVLANDPSLNCTSVTDEWRSLDEDGQVGYYRDVQGRVYLEGIAERCGTPEFSYAFILPPGFRPPHQDNLFAGASHSTADVVQVQVNSNGEVRPPNGPGSPPQTSLDGISFRCGPSGQDGCP